MSVIFSTLTAAEPTDENVLVGRDRFASAINDFLGDVRCLGEAGGNVSDIGGSNVYRERISITIALNPRKTKTRKIALTLGCVQSESINAKRQEVVGVLRQTAPDILSLGVKASKNRMRRLLQFRRLRN